MAESAGAARMSPGIEERRVVCFCLLGATQHREQPVSLGPGAEPPIGFPTMSVLTCPAPWASGVHMDRVSSKLSLLASVGMFEPLLCLGVETRSWQKKVNWEGIIVRADGRLGLEQGTCGARRIEVSVPWGVKVFRSSTKSGS